VLVDPKGLDFTKYRGASLITPNLREAALAAGVEITDRQTLARAGRILLEQAEATGIIITRGKDGSTLITEKKLQDFPVKPVEIVDVTGAGDTVIAVLGLALANSLHVEHAVALANVSARLVVSRFGAATVTLEEMVDSLKEEPLGSKIASKDEIGLIIRNRRLHGRQVVFTNGCFDLFHPGHLEVLKKASGLGDVLVVGVNSDSSVARIKGPTRPILPQSDRVAMLTALSFVDYVVIFDEDTPLAIIEEVQPDILVKGSDWRGKEVIGESVVKARGGRVEFVELINGLSTTSLINKIRAGG
jgi:D-beta-D-heptose 7-phosphate kinase/D-beta-D-heptose 1-phosphate adenosyltransferase